MNYSRIRFLERAVEVQQLTLFYKNRGMAQNFIYRNYIEPQFKISESTFNNYLRINAKRELSKIYNNHKIKAL